MGSLEAQNYLKNDPCSFSDLNTVPDKTKYTGALRRAPITSGSEAKELLDTGQFEAMRGHGLGKDKNAGLAKAVQERLIAHGYELEADSKFGGETEKLVEHFQRKNGLVVDGKVGARTWEKLRNDPDCSTSTVATPQHETTPSIDKNSHHKQTPPSSEKPNVTVERNLKTPERTEANRAFKRVAASREEKTNIDKSPPVLSKENEADKTPLKSNVATKTKRNEKFDKALDKARTTVKELEGHVSIAATALRKLEAGDSTQMNQFQENKNKAQQLVDKLGAQREALAKSKSSAGRERFNQTKELAKLRRSLTKAEERLADMDNKLNEINETKARASAISKTKIDAISTDIQQGISTASDISEKFKQFKKNPTEAAAKDLKESVQSLKKMRTTISEKMEDLNSPLPPKVVNKFRTLTNLTNTAELRVEIASRKSRAPSAELTELKDSLKSGFESKLGKTGHTFKVETIDGKTGVAIYSPEKTIAPGVVRKSELKYFVTAQGGDKFTITDTNLAGKLAWDYSNEYNSKEKLIEMCTTSAKASSIASSVLGASLSRYLSSKK